jgi:hypothetical protein
MLHVDDLRTMVFRIRGAGRFLFWVPAALTASAIKIVLV